MYHLGFGDSAKQISNYYLLYLHPRGGCPAGMTFLKIKTVFGGYIFSIEPPKGRRGYQPTDQLGGDGWEGGGRMTKSNYLHHREQKTNLLGPEYDDNSNVHKCMLFASP